MAAGSDHQVRDRLLDSNATVLVRHSDRYLTYRAHACKRCATLLSNFCSFPLMAFKKEVLAHNLAHQTQARHAVDCTSTSYVHAAPNDDPQTGRGSNHYVHSHKLWAHGRPTGWCQFEKEMSKGQRQDHKRG